MLEALRVETAAQEDHPQASTEQKLDRARQNDPWLMT